MKVQPADEMFRLAKEVFLEAWFDSKKQYSVQAEQQIQELKEIETNITRYLERIDKTKDETLMQLYENKVKSFLNQKKQIEEQARNNFILIATTKRL